MGVKPVALIPEGEIENDLDACRGWISSREKSLKEIVCFHLYFFL